MSETPSELIDMMRHIDTRVQRDPCLHVSTDAKLCVSTALKK